MRGKVKQDDSTLYRRRITPAYAGKSYLAAVLQGFQQDHPRLCGEKKLTFENYKEIEGSPPPMRGKGKRKMKFEKYMRITPAYAGKSFHVPANGLCYRDHPRLCGEKRRSTLRSLLTLGSPPPMRGKASKYKQFVKNKRITPAYAGKSIHLTALSKCNWDHPRLCGEKGFADSTPAVYLGSPPPMRGKV